MLLDLKIAYTFPDASEISGIPERELRKRTKSGELDTFKVGNRQLISRSTLEVFCYRLELENRHENCGHE